MQFIQHLLVGLYGGLLESLRVAGIDALHGLLVPEQVGVVAIDGVIEDRGAVEELGEERKSFGEKR